MKEQLTTPENPRASRMTFGRVVRKAVYMGIQLAIDAMALAGAFLVSGLIRWNFDWNDFMEFAGGRDILLLQMLSVVGIQMGSFVLCRVYRRMWRFMGLSDFPIFGFSFLLSGGVLAVLRGFQIGVFARIPKSVVLATTLLGMGLVVGMRLVRRVLYERRLRQRNFAMQTGEKVRRVLLLGAGQAGRMLAQELARQGYARQRVIGFLDDDPDKQGALIVGIPVLGEMSALPQVLKDYSIDEVIITIATAPRQQIMRIVAQCRKIGIHPRIIPALHEIACGNVPVGAVREVSIEDLLGRDVVILDSDPIRAQVEGKTVLVTGAGGSIGSELVRQTVLFKPKTLVLLDQSEFALYEINREVSKTADPSTAVVPVVADIANEDRLEEVFLKWHPEGVIHAAAYKHVPMMEDNVREAVSNNVFGTLNVARLAGKYGAKVFVMVSTDKAVNPTSVMGTSKRIAELVVQAAQKEYGKTRYVSVRFGNVLGSSGSVIPLFREQIRNGGPVTVTHPDIKRYFMTIPEASRLVLQAAVMGSGGEIFVLDMGTPIKIANLAERMIELSGLKPNVDIAIQYTGLRPGEKMFEELSVRGEHAEKTRHPKIFIGKIAQPDVEWLKAGLQTLRAAMEDGEEKPIRRAMQALVPEAALERLD